MIAVKANKQYTITEAEKKSYLAQGYDIIGDNGAVEHSPQATVPYAEYEKAQAEIAKLHDELAQVRAAKTKRVRLNVPHFCGISDLMPRQYDNRTAVQRS